MKKFLFCLFALLIALPLFAQVDPQNTADAVTILPSHAAGAFTTSAYAVLASVPGEVILFEFETTDVGTTSFTVQGTIDSEAAVVGNTAVWAPLVSDTDFAGFTVPGIVFLRNAPSYIRVTGTVAANHIVIKMRGPLNTGFRKVN